MGDSTKCLTYFKMLEAPLSSILYQMAVRGIRVDLDYLRNLKDELEAQQKPIKDEILNDLGPINLNSPKQLLKALNEKEIYPTLKGKPSTDKRALQSCSEERVIKNLLTFSELDTLLSSFVNPYLERGQEYIHPFYNQVGTRTGRLSCSNPNLLQIPRKTENGKKVRKMFIPRDGMVMGEADYSSIEPRLLAHLSKDPALLQLFNDRVDFHGYFAGKLNIDRDSAKVFDLETYYGATEYGVDRHLKCGLEQAKAYIKMAWDLFPTLRRWRDKTLWDAKRNGYITTLLGRRIKIDNLDSGNSWKREAAERQTMNNLCQASAREVMALGMLKVSKDSRFNPTFGLLVQIYDSLVAETPNSQNFNYLVEDMETAIRLDVPLKADLKVGSNWGEMEKVK